MKPKTLVIAILAACLGTATSAMAHPYNDRYAESYRPYHGYRHWHHHHHHMRGAGPYHDLRPGDRLPMAFWDRHYRVHDWRRARLGPPMYGCHWVRVGDDYVQVSVSTGLITDVLVLR